MNKIKVYIDAGHGGNDSGATKKGYKESNIVLNVALKLKSKLLATGKFDVMMSRETDKYVLLSERTNDANIWGADILISIHANSSNNKLAHGLETFCYKYNYGKLANDVNNGILSSISINNRGVKEGNLHMVRESKMNACLVELGFISNDDDLNLLLNNQDDYAYGIFKGIMDYYNLSIENNNPSSDKLYIVAHGAFKDIDNAKKLMNELKSKGIDTYIHSC